MAILTAYLGLGTNLGERQKNLEIAARLLFQTSSAEVGLLRPLRSSSVYETAPWGHTSQPDFLNCVLEVETDLQPLGRTVALNHHGQTHHGHKQENRHDPEETEPKGGSPREARNGACTGVINAVAYQPDQGQETQ